MTDISHKWDDYKYLNRTKKKSPKTFLEVSLIAFMKVFGQFQKIVGQKIDPIAKCADEEAEDKNVNPA